MTDRSHLAAPRYAMPAGYTDAVAHDDGLIKSQPRRAGAGQKPHPRSLTTDDLIARVTETTGAENVSQIVDAVFQELRSALVDHQSVQLPGFGKFSVAKKPVASSKARSGQIVRKDGVAGVAPRAKRPAKSRASFVAKFQPSAELRSLRPKP